MEETFQPFRTPSGRLVPRGPVVATWDDELKAVTGGHAVIAAAAEATGFYSRPGLVWVPVRDAPRCQWAFVWRTADQNPLIRAFTAAAADAADALADRPA
jgi:hypothetical protein